MELAIALKHGNLLAVDLDRLAFTLGHLTGQADLAKLRHEQPLPKALWILAEDLS